MRITAFITLLLTIALFITACSENPLENLFNKNQGNSSVENNGTGDDDSKENQNPSDANNDDYQANVDDFIYEINNGAVTITKYIGSSSHVSIPDSIEDLPVTTIKSGTFVSDVIARSGNADKNKDQYTIYIPDTVDKIEEDAFKNNGNVYITNHKEKPDGWKDSSFMGDAANEHNEHGNMYFKYQVQDCFVIDGIVYLYNNHLKGYFVVKCFSNKTEIVIPSSIKNIPVNNIGRDAFKDCVFLKKITLSKNTIYIYHSAFENCVSLKEVNFNSKIISKILAKSFYNCSSLEKVILPEGNFLIQSSAFANCGTLTELYIPMGMSSVADNAFSGTTVDTIYYGGNNIFDYLWMNKLPSYSNLVLGERKAVEGISSIASVKELDLGVEVTIRGYVASKCEGSSERFIVVDENNENGILVQIRINDIISPNNIVTPSFGQYVEIVGYTSNYNGLFSISSIRSIEVVGGSKMIEPIKLSNNEVNKHYDDYIYRYIELEGTVDYMENNYTYLRGLDIVLFSRASNNPMLIGNKVSIKGTLLYFGNICEFQYDYNDVIIKNDVKPQIISITEAKTDPIGKQVTVQGCVATYITSTSFLIVDEKNEDGITVYIPSEYSSSELPKFGDIIEVTGFTYLYNNMFEITNIHSFSIIGHKELEPIKISLDTEWDNYTDFAYRYIEFEGSVNHELSEAKYTYFYNVPIKHYLNESVNPLLSANKVLFRGTVLIYNDIYQLRAMYDNIIILEDLVTAE